MFVGIDVYHDVRKVFPSVVGLIASMNNSCTKYFSKVCIQRIHQEITDNMQPLFSEALESYAEVRTKLLNSTNQVILKPCNSFE